MDDDGRAGLRLHHAKPHEVGLGKKSEGICDRCPGKLRQVGGRKGRRAKTIPERKIKRTSALNDRL